MRPELLQPLEAARVGVPAGEHGPPDHRAESLEQPLGQRPVLRRDHEEVRALRDGLGCAFGVYAMHAHE